MLAKMRWLGRPVAVLSGGFLALALISSVSAQEADPVEDLTGALDSAWLMLAAVGKTAAGAT